MRLITVQLNFLNIRYRCGMQSNGLAPEFISSASVIVKTRCLCQSYQLAICPLFIGFRSTEKEKFVFRSGSVFCNLFLADEINRTSPKTQSALLEAMEERQASVEGKTYKLPSPFVVIATENPLGSSGTQKLPESQMDRFMIRISMVFGKR